MKNFIKTNIRESSINIRQWICRKICIVLDLKQSDISHFTYYCNKKLKNNTFPPICFTIGFIFGISEEPTISYHTDVIPVQWQHGNIRRSAYTI